MTYPIIFTPGEQGFAAKLTDSFAAVPFFNTALYGAAGNGIADDSVPIQAAIDAAAEVGGTVYAPAGTYRATLIARAGVTIQGDGPGTVLKAVAGSDDDVIKGDDFATLSGKDFATGDYALGCPEFELRDIVIDGDKANNAAGYGVRIWGRAPRFMGAVEIRNCKSGGLWTEFTEVDSFADPTQVLEGVAHSLVIQNCDGHGWTHRGPHDFVVHEANIWGCTGWAVRVEQEDDSYNGGVYFRHLNFYLCANGAFVGGSSLFKMHGGAITGDEGTGLEFEDGSGGALVQGVIVAGHETGIILRGTSHRIDVQVDRNTVNGIEVDGAINCRVDMHGAGNENVLAVTSEDGPNFITGLFDVATGNTLKSGAAFNSGGFYFLRAYGTAGNSSTQQLPSATLTAAGWSPILPPSNGTLIPGMVTSATYGTTVTPDASAGIFQRVGVTNTSAFTMAAPTNGKTWPLTLEFVNNSGGAMGAITWNAAYKLAGAFTNPASTKRRTITFQEISGEWVEIARAAADI